VLDLDGTIVTTKNNEYEYAQPKKEMIDKINKLYNEGHTIIIRTGRGSKSGKDWTDLTIQQLREWGVKYHTLIMDRCKPECDWIIDDKNMSISEFLKW
jgi:carbamoyl-phosphate synthase large subunit